MVCWKGDLNISFLSFSFNGEQFSQFSFPLLLHRDSFFFVFFLWLTFSGIKKGTKIIHEGYLCQYQSCHPFYGLVLFPYNIKLWEIC